MKVNYTNETPAADDLYRLYDHEGWNDFFIFAERGFTSSDEPKLVCLICLS